MIQNHPSQIISSLTDEFKNSVDSPGTSCSTDHWNVEQKIPEATEIFVRKDMMYAPILEALHCFVECNNTFFGLCKNKPKFVGFI